MGTSLVAKGPKASEIFNFNEVQSVKNVRSWRISGCNRKIKPSVEKNRLFELPNANKGRCYGGEGAENTYKS